MQAVLAAAVSIPWQLIFKGVRHNVEGQFHDQLRFPDCVSGMLPRFNGAGNSSQWIQE